MSAGAASSQLSSDLAAVDEQSAADIMANNALSSSLTHVRALRVIGMQKFNAGDTENGRKMIQLAGQQSWRDSVTHAWLLEQSLIAGNYAASIDHADALLLRQRAQDGIFNIFTIAILEPKLVKPIVDKFANDPSWRPKFFAYAKNVPDNQLLGFETIITSIAGSASPATRDEISLYANRLSDSGFSRRALELWAALFPEDSNFLLQNKSLEMAWQKNREGNKQYPIDWRYSESRSVFAFVDNDISGDAATLNLELERGAVGEIASRLMILPTGNVKLSLGENDANEPLLSKLRWTLTCTYGDNKTPITFAPSTNEGLEWSVQLNQPCSVYKLSMSNPAGGLSREARLRINSPIISHGS